MAAATTAILAGVSLASAYSESQSLGLQADFEKKQAEANSQILDIKARNAVANGEKDASLLKKKAAAVKGDQRAALAASGVVVDFGSGQQAQDENDLFSSIDAEKIKNNAMLEAWGYEVEKSNTLFKAKMSGIAAQGKQANTLLTGGVSAAKAFGGG